jgi:hypothetical protein
LPRIWDARPETVLMVGDSLHDLKAGRAAGMRTAGVLTGIAAAEDLAPFADVVLPDIGLCPRWLAEVRRGVRAPAVKENDTACRGLAMSVRRPVVY